MKSPLVSVIVPVHNTPSIYLDECLESILQQTYSFVEVIIIDDGSNMETRAACDVYLHDKRVQVIHTKNHGVSSARNTGIKKMTGDFVLFVDADDVLDVMAVERLVSATVSQRADVVIAQHTEIRGELSVLTSDPYLLKKEDVLENLFYGKGVSATCFAKLYSSEIIRMNYFNNKLAFAEDLEFNSRVLSSSNRIGLIGDALYFYRQNPSGAIRSAFSARRMDGLVALELILKQHKTFDRLKKAVISRYFMEAIFIGVKLMTAHGKNDVELARCLSVIKSLRVQVFSNKAVPSFVRLIACISYADPRSAIKLYLFKMKIRKQL